MVGGGGVGGRRTATTNPFDDDLASPRTNAASANPFDSGGGGGGGGGVRGPGAAAMNPFDDGFNSNNDNGSYGPTGGGGGDATAGEYYNYNDDDNETAFPSTAGDSTTATMAPAEASWQYLGDLPYRRIPVYSNVNWHNGRPSSRDEYGDRRNSRASDRDEALYRHGLASYPPSALRHHPSLLTPREVRQLLATSTNTLVAGCPHGGPVAAMTLPLVATPVGGGPKQQQQQPQQKNDSFRTTQLRILSNAGMLLTSIDFPPLELCNSTAGGIGSKDKTPPSKGADGSKQQQQSHQQGGKAGAAGVGDAGSAGGGRAGKQSTNRAAGASNYTPADVLQIGFTSRTSLVVVLRDSLCLVYNLRGDLLLQPFYIMPRGGRGAAGEASPPAGGGYELVQAVVYEGGVAVLAANKNSAIVELFDEHDNSTEYLQTAHITARKVSSSPVGSESFLETYGGAGSGSHYALITPLPTSSYASEQFLQQYLCIAVLPRSRTQSRHPEVYLSTNDNSVVVVNVATCDIVDVNCRSRIVAPIVDMSFAPNGRFLACFTESSMLTVISTSFETKVLDFDTSEGSTSPPNTMVWCGEDSVLLHWNKLGVLMVGPYGDWLRFPYENTENVYLIPEIDCCRVLTDNSVELLQRVPPATALMLRIGSIETSAMLLDASDAFDSGLAASDDAARAIIETGMLLEAIETCSEAACREFCIATQKRLLRAASFGMHFNYKQSTRNDNNEESVDTRVIVGGPLRGSDPSTGILPTTTTTKFVAIARKLRVMNALRNPKVGFVLTSAQYDAITPVGVVARLIEMQRPALACSIAKYLGLSQAVQLFARASKAAALVAMADPNTHSDTEIAEAAIRIINEDSSLSNEQEPRKKSSTQTSTNSMSRTTSRGGYAMVALAASKAGRKGVANLLLMLETSIADKVPALLSTGSYADAMAVATTARDADFIFSTLMEFETACMASAASTDGDVSKAQASFLYTVVSRFTPEAFHTLRRYLMTMTDIKSVTNLLLRAQRFTDAGATMAQRALRETDLREKQGILSEASRVFGLGKETAFYKTCTDDYLELLKDQEVLRTKYGSNEVAPEGASVARTIASILKFAATNMREQHRLLADVDKIAKKFRISEKRLWHIKVKAFAVSEQWSNLRLLADSKTKSPIGYKPFARAAIKGKQNPNEVMKYIERVTISEEKYDLFCESSMWKKALDEAVKLRDPRRVLNVKTLCNSPELQLMADQMLARMA